MTPRSPADALIGEKIKLFFIIIAFTLLASPSPFHNERHYNRLLAHCLQGEAESKIAYRLNHIKRIVRADVETEKYVIEAGLDYYRSTLDSVQQVLFFLIHRPQKQPVIIIYDTDNKEGTIEHQIRLVCQRLGITFKRVSAYELEKGLCPPIVKIHQ